jgi:hypothetical protein
VYQKSIIYLITGGVLFDSMTGIGQLRLKTDQSGIQLCKTKHQILSAIQPINIKETKK